MPEDIIETTELQMVLCLLEDDTLEKPAARTHYYKQFQSALDNGIHLTASMIDRLLAICISDLQDNKKICVDILNLINSILSDIKAGEFSAGDVKNLVPSFLAVLSITKTIVLVSKVDTLLTISFNTLLSYPDSVLIEVVTSYSVEVTAAVFNLYCHPKVSQDIKKLTCELVNKLLKTLPNDQKNKFVRNNLSLWFSTLIPKIFSSLQNEGQYSKPLETLELLTEELVQIDYSEDTNWLELLECIYNPQKYPLVMKSMLENGSKIWHRLWIVCIRLLKNQITRSNNPIGSPINSMLPVVELAFKMDVSNRCRAFKCWAVLIDNFHTETNEVYVVKRLKLLIIPLRSNNAKVEETALAKLQTWWHLIYRFQNRLDKFADMVVISFLHFCFGKQASSQKPAFVPGLISSKTKKLAVHALIELTGQLCCSGCVNMPKLDNRLFTKNILVDYWNDWVYSLKVATTITNDNSELTMQQVTCLWKSFAMVISELPDNNIRKDLFNELLMLLDKLLEDSDMNSRYAEMVFILIKALFEEEKIKPLLKTTGAIEGPMHKIISIVMKPAFNIYYRRFETKDIVLQFKSLTNLGADETICSTSSIVKWMLSDVNLPPDNISYLWTAFAETQYELKANHDCMCLVLWPLKSKNCFVDVKYSSQVWYRLFCITNLKLIDEHYSEIRAFLTSNVTPLKLILKLYATLGLINHSPPKSIDFQQKHVELLSELLNKVTDHNQLDDLFPILTDTLVALLKPVKDVVIKYTISCIKILLKIITPVFREMLAKENYTEKMEVVLKHVDILFQKKNFLPLSVTIINELADFGCLLEDHPLRKCVLSLLKTCLSHFKDNKPIQQKIKFAITTCEKDTNKIVEQGSGDDKFTTPDTKAIVTKSKKKEVSIVNTVVENGEEYIVVRSNWKFNPRKLTENQKEKFQRKREDIPALYQDLSQSQDEFKMKTWKADSQDSSSTSSKSTTASKTGNADDVSNILKNIPSSDVVPKIIENINSDNTKKDDTSEIKLIDDNVAKIKHTSTPQDARSPRMALKDRVFRNVRNLIEKSNLQKDKKDLSESLIQIENIPKTPTSKALECDNLVNSAPSKICAERPSRVKRKPKKFDDTELFALRKGHRSLSQGDSQPETDMTNEPLQEAEMEERSKEEIETDIITESLPKNVVEVPEVDIDKIKVIDTSNVAKVVDAKQQINEAVTDEITVDKVTAHNEENSAKKIVSSVSVDNTANKDATTELTSEINVSPYVLADTVSGPENEKQETKQESLSQENTDTIESSSDKNVKTPRTRKRLEAGSDKSSVKKSAGKKSRIEKELAIDTVEGHPFLKIQTEKRVTRKNLSIPLNTSRRKSLTEKLNKSKTECNKNTPKTLTSVKKKDKERSSSENDVVVEKSETCADTSDDFPLSEDIIESSQESTFTAISVTSNKNNLKKLSVIVEKVQLAPSNSDAKIKTQSLLEEENSINSSVDCTNVDNDSKEDIELSRNKTVADRSEMNATETMDTEPMDELSNSKDSSSDVIIINEDEPPIVINSDETCVGTETQEIAEADTLPTDPNDFPMEHSKKTLEKLPNKLVQDKFLEESKVDQTLPDIVMEMNTEDDATKTMSESIDLTEEAKTASSPFKDEEQRKKDFLDNTLEISPIKNMSPVREEKTPSPETSSDYVVIKLSAPVQSNGEPFEKCDSPEIFTEEKVSPDKRDLSPPREESVANDNSSPSSSLSLKKNRPQVRSGGRAAQMLCLCVPDRLQTLINSERSEQEEPKKSSPSSTPVRRNLRILYNSVGDNSENSEENEDSENFLKFKKSLPMSDCSPSGPILKRKLAEITDEATVSPASKRKRVSFHDPPVSTTISVQKYIEPGGIRSPQNSAIKRQERQNMRSQVILKSPKRLENVFKLDSVLTKTVESFTEINITSSDDTQSMSLDETPAVEIVKNSDLNDTDPICLDLVDCNDPIDNIASELSSSTMKTVFLKELEGKIATVGDLAKMTELEVNRLCIKAPKIKVTKKVLTDYMAKRMVPELEEPIEMVEDVGDAIKSPAKMEIETQTSEVVMTHSNMQTVATPVAVVSVQTDKMETSHTSAQTNESGSKSTKDMITSCLAEKPDFVEQLGNILEDTSKQEIAETLPLDVLTDAIMTKLTEANSNKLITRVLKKYDTPSSGNGQLSFLQNYLCDKFDSKNLILFCSQLLAKIHEKPT